MLFNKRYIKLVNLQETLKRGYINTFDSCRNITHNNNYQRLSSSFQSRFYSAGDVFDVPVIDIKAITNGDESLEHKLKVIILEAEVMRQEGRAVPENKHMKMVHWKELLSLPSRGARTKYFEYLFKLSKKIENQIAKKLEKQLKWDEHVKSSEKVKKEETYEDFALTYGLNHNNLFLRFYDTTINQFHNNKLIQAIMFGQKLIIDCGYDENMTNRENVNCAKQLMLLFADNRVHEDPFDLHFCNANREGLLMKQLKKRIPTMDEPSFPLNVHECSYLDIFPRDQLVYLTPNCHHEITEYDHDAVYIIGAIVDKMNNQPLSLAKAKRENIRMMKLPLDKYLNWGAGSGKSLTLNQVTGILLDIKVSGDWNLALRHVPKRKLVDSSISNNVDKYSDQLRYDSPPRKVWSPKFKKFDYPENRDFTDNRRKRISVKDIIK